MLRKEVDRVEMSQYFGLECDSDNEIEEDESDAEYFSDDEVIRRPIDYDLEKMFEIIKRRDFHNWSMETINHHFRKITDRMQITRYSFFLCNFVAQICDVNFFGYSECEIT